LAEVEFVTHKFSILPVFAFSFNAQYRQVGVPPMAEIIVAMLLSPSGAAMVYAVLNFMATGCH
jgi:hypothetical protein